MDVHTSFGAWLQRRRKALDLTQADLAQRVSCALGTIRKIELDERRPSKQIAARLADQLQLAPTEREIFLKAARAEVAVNRLASVTPLLSEQRVDSSQLPRGTVSQTNLPLQPTPLFGREYEIGDVSALLHRPDVRLVTLTGPGGVGKTRLALQVAAELLDDDLPPAFPAQREPVGERHFPDGIYFVNLAPISDPNLVAATIAQTLELRESAGQSLMETLKAYLRDKRVLLLLDNFEQVVEAAPVVAALLTAAPRLTVLITSRAVLHLRGEKEITVPPLALPNPKQLPPLSRLTQYAAVALFIERAQDVQPNFTLTNENALAVAKICARLDGLPLAIELAASRVKLFSPEALLNRLERRLPLLTGGARDLPTRQQTLRNTIEWSYHLLPPETQTLFRRLAVFVAGCALEAVEVVCERASDSELNVLESMQALLDHSLVRQVEGPDGEPRFVLLETIREYALEQLEQSGEAESVRGQHAHFFLRLVEASAPQRFGWPQRVWLERLEAEHDNVRAALAWTVRVGQAELAVQLATAMSWFWWEQGYVREGQHWLETGLGMRDTLPAAVRATALGKVAALATPLGDYERAKAPLQESLALWRELGNQEQIARTLFNLGVVAISQGDHAQATTLLEESLAYFRDQDDQVGIAGIIGRLGSIALDQGDYPRAAALLEESLARFRALGDKDATASTLHFLSYVLLAQGDLSGALALKQESLALYQELGSKSQIPWVLIGLGSVIQQQGDGAQAHACFVESLTRFCEMGSRRGLTLCLARLAGVAGMQGQPVRAARLFGAAEALGEALDEPHTAGHQRYIARNVEIARIQIDEATFMAAWAEGRTMTMEQAIVYALEE